MRLLYKLVYTLVLLQVLIFSELVVSWELSGGGQSAFQNPVRADVFGSVADSWMSADLPFELPEVPIVLLPGSVDSLVRSCPTRYGEKKRERAGQASAQEVPSKTIHEICVDYFYDDFPLLNHTYQNEHWLLAALNRFKFEFSNNQFGGGMIDDFLEGLTRSVLSEIQELSDDIFFRVGICIDPSIERSFLYGLRAVQCREGYSKWAPQESAPFTRYNTVSFEKKGRKFVVNSLFSSDLIPRVSGLLELLCVSYDEQFKHREPAQIIPFLEALGLVERSNGEIRSLKLKNNPRTVKPNKGGKRVGTSRLLRSMTQYYAGWPLVSEILNKIQGIDLQDSTTGPETQLAAMSVNDELPSTAGENNRGREEARDLQDSATEVELQPEERVKEKPNRQKRKTESSESAGYTTLEYNELTESLKPKKNPINELRLEIANKNCDRAKVIFSKNKSELLRQKQWREVKNSFVSLLTENKMTGFIKKHGLID